MKSIKRIWKAVMSLTPPQLLRLKEYAKWRMRWLNHRAAGCDYEDLLAEAITTTVSGKRTWGEGIDLCSHLLGAMRSISTSWHEKKGEELYESDLVCPEGTPLLDQGITTLDPERILSAKERLEQVRNLFTNDEAALEIIELLGLGYTAKEIQSRLDISKQHFEAVAKRIKRKLTAIIPEGQKTRLKTGLTTNVIVQDVPQRIDANREVYKQSEQYKLGWVHGFYDCASDDGAFFGGDLRSNSRDGSNGIMAEDSYERGYLDGRIDRLRGQLRWCHEFRQQEAAQIPGAA